MRELTIPATDGYSLGATVFEGDGSGPVVVVGSAMGVKRRFYAKVAGYLAERGMTVVTFDNRGIGGSRPPTLRGFEARLLDFYERDFEGVARWVQREYPARRLTMLGHSAGSWSLALAPSGGAITRAVTVGTSTANFRQWPVRWWWVCFFVWYLMMPLASRLLGYLPGALLTGSDLPRGVALDWARWARKARFFLDEGLAPANIGRVRIPILSFSMGDDFLAPEPGVDLLHSWFANATVTRRRLRARDYGKRKLGHHGLFRSELREPLWREVADFLLAG